MATYKLIQDIEAEDKILGPLTFRQFVFALVAAFLGYLCFISIANHLWPLLVLFFPPFLLTVFFAFPFGRDQPTEVWALAIMRFWFKPHKRIWDQSGLKELVTITAPKKIEHTYTDGLSQTEVQSRLKALANTLDTRGWAIKNPNLASYVANPLAVNSSERLFDIAAVPTSVQDTGLRPSDDMLDEEHNPVAQQFDNMINRSAEQRRTQLISELNSSGPQPAAPTLPTTNWFIGSSAPGQAQAAAPITPVAPDDAALSAQIHANAALGHSSYGNLRTLKPQDNRSQTPMQPTSQTSLTTVTTPSHPAILALATNNDLNVSTIAREAKKATGEEEVVISLH